MMIQKLCSAHLCRYHGMIVNTPKARVLALLLSLILPMPGYAIAPVLKYAGFSTALQAEYSFYSAWIAMFGKVQCSFGQLTWVDTPTAVNGYVPFSDICGYGHVLPVVIAKVFVCPAGYTLLNYVIK